MVKNLKKILILNSLIIFFSFFVNINMASAGTLANDQICTKNSDCISSCCYPDVNQDEELKFYYYGILKGYKDVVNPQLTNINNICWDTDVCNSGYDLEDLQITQCGCASGGTFSSKPTTSTSGLCFNGTASDIKEDNVNKKYTWKCKTLGKGTLSKSCSANKGSVNKSVGATCFNYSDSVSSKPSSGMLCICGESTEPRLVDSEWVWSCYNDSVTPNEQVECSVTASISAPEVQPETNPLSGLQSTSEDKTSATTNNYPDVKIPNTKSIDNYTLIEKLSQKCTILYDKDCEAIDRNLLDAINSKLTIQEAIDKNKINPNWKIGRESDNYETGFTLENIKKIKSC